MTDKTIIIAPKEPIGTSMARDTFTVLCAIALAVPGWWFGSWVLETIGFIVFCVVILTRASQLLTQCRFTPDEARAKIAEWESGQ